ncbi:hypothetical protein Efla_005936 [Eimeria flavescens]
MLACMQPQRRLVASAKSSVNKSVIQSCLRATEDGVHGEATAAQDGGGVEAALDASVGLASHCPAPSSVPPLMPNLPPSADAAAAACGEETDEFAVLRQKATEPPGTGRSAEREYEEFSPKSGCFVCRGCGAPLFPASSKFKSGCGWPAFDMAYKGEPNPNGGMRRWEIICSACGGHLGHVFKGERLTPTNERHCVNSLSIRYQKAEPSPALQTETISPE